MESGSLAHAIIVVNPAAGGATSALVNAAVNECLRWWYEVTVHHLGPHLTADELIARTVGSPHEPPAAVVVAIGGDGTARDVAVALSGAVDPPPLFVIPAGTANSCYRTWWGDQPWGEALRLAAVDPAGSRQLLDLATLKETGALVLAGACAGFPPQAIHEAKQLTGLTGRARYEAALGDLVSRFEPYPGRVEVDGLEVHRGATLLANVGGSRFRGGLFELLPRSVLDDGLLDVVVIGGEHDPAAMLRCTRDAAHLGMPGVVYARGRRVTIERTDGRPMWFEHDGEVLLDGGHSFTLEVVPDAVPVLIGPWAWPASGGGSLSFARAVAAAS